MTMWTHFWDMNSGGGRKEQWAHIFIEAPESEAKVVFYNRFGHNPERVTCTCCGEDYSILEGESLAEITGFHRNLRYAEDERGWHYGNRPADYRDGRYLEPGEEVPEGYKVSKLSAFRQGEMTLDEYVTSAGVLVIRADEITPEERIGDVPEQGYVWRD